MGQKIIKIKSKPLNNNETYDFNKLCNTIKQWIIRNSLSNVFFVTIRSIKRYPLILNLIKETSSVHFINFTPNPTFEEVMEGYRIFKEKKCDAIIAIGGGSAIDVAKCIKFYNLKNDCVPLLVIPTTAGTGSEATKFAVMYKEGVKTSIEDEHCLPDAVMFDYHFLETLPLYQKKVTLMDAFCHGLESFWSVNSTRESRCYSKGVLENILENVDEYLKLNNEAEVCKKIFEASFFAGKAINIAKTTAGHAMCYKITSMYGLAHGHAAILCNKIIFRWMIENIEQLDCIDSRGRKYVEDVLKEIAYIFGTENLIEACDRLDMFVDKLELEVPCASDKEIEELVLSVNEQRMKNHPFLISEKNIDTLYKKILNYDIISKRNMI